MKKLLVVVLVAFAAAAAIWFGTRGASSKISSAAVTSLLPKETLFLVHLPDLNGTRAEFHQTDLYQLWREPAVQDFLQKPMTKMPDTNSARQKFQELDVLEMKDAFFALTSWENKQSKILAGFRFKGTPESAEKVIGQWRARAQEKSPPSKRESVSYQQHQIEVVTRDAFSIATVYDGAWFFAGNDLDALKALLDRADRRVTDSAGTLGADDGYLAASRHMPASYVARLYARVDTYLAKMSETLPPSTTESEQFSLLRKIRSLSAATSFDKGKIRDLSFVAMPQSGSSAALSRESLSLATRDAFLYAATMINWPTQMPAAPDAAATGFPAAIQRLLAVFAANGITPETWNNTFASEISVIGEWSSTARLPSLFATLPVKDAAKASELIAQFVAATSDDRPWTKTEKDGVQYFSQAPANPMVPIAPTLVLSTGRLVLGHDPTALENVMKRSGAKGTELEGADSFKAAERIVPAPKYSFTYFDLGLLYTRLDSAIRPMLVMAAAFMPSIADTVDLGKLPAAEIITKHLSPIVISQSYENDGYVTESVGPISIYQAIIGVAASAGYGASLYPSALPNHSPAPLVSPTPTPGGS